MKNKLDFDIQNAFRYANFTVQERCEHKFLSPNDKKYWFNVTTILAWSEIIGAGFSSLKPSKINNYLDLYTTQKYDELKEYVVSKFGNKNIKQNCKAFLDCLKDYIRIVDKVWNQGEKKLFVEFDETYIEKCKAKLKKFLK